jgi:hypothetical protein
MRRTALLALSLAGTADAHRLDEYLQATLIGVTRDAIEIEIHLTPGVQTLPVLMAVIDQDRDGQISPAEERTYVDRVAREVQLQIDGVPAPVSLIESSFPTLEAMREGLGTIRMKLRTAHTGHRLRFENRHLPQVSAYLVNCLAAQDLVVSRQERDEAQKSIEFEYSFGPSLGSFWPAAIGMLLLARMALLIVAHAPRRAASTFVSTSGTAAHAPPVLFRGPSPPTEPRL